MGYNCTVGDAGYGWRPGEIGSRADVGHWRGQSTLANLSHDLDTM